MEKKHLLIICGEASGELHATHLIKALKEINPDLVISGVGSSRMQALGVELYYDIKGLAVFGFFDALRKLPRFLSLKKYLLKKISQDKPDAIILIDFSGFNLRLAQAVKGKIPLVYYISPQVWASRPGRIKTIKKYISKMIVIFKFEEEFYRKHGIDVDFIGHPLLDIVKPDTEKKDFLDEFNLSGTKLNFCLLPGSRSSVINNILPIMLKTASLIKDEIKDAQFIIAKSPNVSAEFYNRKISGLNLDLRIIEGKTYDCLNAADFCLVASGTATIETAIMQKPFVIIYKMGLLNYLLYRPQVKVPFIGMVNIVAGKKVIPEFIQFKAKPKDIANHVIKTLKNPAELQRLHYELAQVKFLLGQKGACLRAAKIILDFIK